MLMKHWRRFRTRFTLWFLEKPNQLRENESFRVQEALALIDTSVLKDINHPQTTGLHIHSISSNVVATSAILQQAVIELQAGRRITNVFAEINNQRVRSNRYFLDSKGNYIDYEIPLKASIKALIVLQQYMDEHKDSTETVQLMNCRAIEYQLPHFYQYLISLMRVAAYGPLRK